MVQLSAFSLQLSEVAVGSLVLLTDD